MSQKGTQTSDLLMRYKDPGRGRVNGRAVARIVLLSIVVNTKLCRVAVAQLLERPSKVLGLVQLY